MTVQYHYGSLSHSGILGMRWGRRRWQNEDGSLTEAGRVHYGYRSTREQNRHAEKMNSQNIALTKATQNVDRDAYKSKYDIKKLQVKQDAQKQRDAALKYKHDEEMAKIAAKSKRDAEKAKYRDAEQKRRNDREKIRNEYKLEKLREKNASKLDIMNAETDRIDVEKDYSEVARQQRYDYNYDKQVAKLNTKTIAKAAIAVAGSAYVISKLKNGDSDVARAAQQFSGTGKALLDSIFRK